MIKLALTKIRDYSDKIFSKLLNSEISTSIYLIPFSLFGGFAFNYVLPSYEYAKAIDYLPSAFIIFIIVVSGTIFVNTNDTK